MKSSELSDRLVFEPWRSFETILRSQPITRCHGGPGEHPRNFSIHPSGNWILVANQDARLWFWGHVVDDDDDDARKTTAMAQQ